jgi:hypothetical protein
LNLFKIEVSTRRRVYDVLAHAESSEQAARLVQSKFTGA